MQQPFEPSLPLSGRGDFAMGTPLGRAVTFAMLAFVAVKLVLLAILSVNTQYLMDEYPHVIQALLVDQNPYQDVWPYKTLLYAYFYRFAFWLGGDAVEVMRIARVQTFVLTLIVLGVLYGVARNLERSRLEGLFVVSMALGFSSYMEWAFTARPETLAVVFTVAALWVVTRWSARPWACLAAGLLSGASFLTLQKAGYFNLALGLALVGEGLLRRSPIQAFTSGALLVLGWAILFGIYVGAFTIQGADPVAILRHIFFGPPTRNAAFGHLVYENLRLFTWLSFTRNIPAYVFCVFGWIIVRARLGLRPGPEGIAWIFTAVIVGLIYGFHSAPWPYNFVMAIPFLALWGPCVIEVVRQRPERIRLMVLALLLVVISPSFIRNLRYLEHDNAFQTQTMRTAESFLAPKDRYFDGVHMIVTRPHATSFWLQRSVVLDIRAAAERGDVSTLETIFAEQPKLVILSYRTKFIEAALAPFLAHSYLPVAPNILLAGTTVAAGEATVFEARWAGAYRLYGADGRPSTARLLADGREVAGALRLDLGPHRLRLVQEAGPLYLLPANLERPVTVLPEAVQEPLFDRAHNF